jgi:hypothetical protein
MRRTPAATELPSVAGPARLTGADRGLALTDWRAEYDRLREDRGDVEVGRVSDSATAEAP